METTRANLVIKMVKTKNSNYLVENDVVAATVERLPTLQAEYEKQEEKTQNDPKYDLETKIDSESTNHTLAILPDNKGNIPERKPHPPLGSKRVFPRFYSYCSPEKTFPTNYLKPRSNGTGTSLRNHSTKSNTTNDIDSTRSTSSTVRLILHLHHGQSCGFTLLYALGELHRQ
ncbi:hypothetical protein Bca4012_020251 [Brassica carinata]